MQDFLAYDRHAEQLSIQYLIRTKLFLVVYVELGSLSFSVCSSVR